LYSPGSAVAEAVAPPAVTPRLVAPRVVVPHDVVVDPLIGANGPALLALEDGTVFHGVSFGAPVEAGGDLVANTSQTGYQEVATDPSYAGQLVVMTYPLIGNYGRLETDDQSERPWLRGLVVAHATAAVVERGRQLVDLLRQWDVPAIAGVDTRAVARHLRETGTLRALITAPGNTDEADAIANAIAVAAWEDQDFVGQVSPRDPYELPPLETRERVARHAGRESEPPLVAIVDYGLKRNIVRNLRERGARVRVLAHTATARDVLAEDVRGVVLSPGPGDPARLAEPTALARAAIDSGRPVLGICLGHQLVGLAAGATTRRLRFGHHGANHPVKDVDSGRVRITAQNHEVQVLADALPRSSGFYVSQLNLNDGSVEGLRHSELPVETVQYHPEGSPGPLDALDVFDRFMARVRRANSAA
jgi:carbamoyl-phosphate synthase small subunit